MAQKLQPDDSFEVDDSFEEVDSSAISSIDDSFEADDSFEPDGIQPLSGIEFKSKEKWPEVTGVRMYPKPVPESKTDALARERGDQRTSEAGRRDEGMFDFDRTMINNFITDRIAQSHLPEWMKAPLVVPAVGISNFGLSIAEMIGADPAAPATGAAGVGSRLAKAAHAADELRLADDLANETRLLARERNPPPVGLSLQSQKAGTPQFNTAQFGLQPLDEVKVPPELAMVPNRLRPPSTNATVFDALLPERLKYNEQGAAQRLTTDVQPPKIQTESLREPITFNGRTLDEINEMVPETLRPPQPVIGTHGSALPFVEETPAKEAAAAVVNSVPPAAKSPGTIAKIASFFEDNAAPAMSAVRNKRGSNVDPATLNNPIARIIVKLRESRKLNVEQRRINIREHGTRAGGIRNAEGTGEDWFRSAKGALKGRFEKVRFEPLELDGTDAHDLMENIRLSNVDDYAKIRAGDALIKMQNGVVPQPNEIKTLSRIFTHQLTRDLNDPVAASAITDEMLESLFAKQARHTQLNQKYLAGLQRSMMTMWDISAPFRQAAGAITNKAWWTSWDDMLKSWHSEELAKAVQDSITSHPNYNLQSRSGLALPDIVNPSKAKGLTEEGFGAPAWAEKYVPGLKKSERSFNAFTGKTRSDLWNEMWGKALKANNGAFSSPEAELEAAKAISRTVNNVTGRGDLASLEKNVGLLNRVFFSPRLMASRIQFFNPKNYIGQPAYIRNQMLRSMGGWAGVAGTANIAGLAAGGSLEVDPRSSDFLKIRFGNTRVDPGAGGLQYLVLLARQMAFNTPLGRVLEGGYKTTFRDGEPGRVIPFDDKSITNPNFKDIFYRFLENKASPGTSLLIKSWEGKDMGGEPYNMPYEVMKTYVPMIAQDMINIMVEDGDLSAEEAMGLFKGENPFSAPEDPRALLAIPATAVGMGSQTYK